MLLSFYTMGTLATPPSGHASQASGASASGVFIMSTVPICLVIRTLEVYVMDDIPGYCEIIARIVWEHKQIVRTKGAVRK